MIDELFRKQVAAGPERVAVSGWDGTLTYRELDDRADELAAELWRAGVRPGGVVAVHHERSAAVVAGLLAVVRIGAGYLALDRRQPADRRAMILADGGVGTVLTRRALVAELPASCAAVCLDGERATGVRVAPDVSVGPEHVAYVAYTSGSTGRPKGVCVPHRAVVRLVRGADYVAIGADDVFVQYAPMAFDAATFEIWGPLLNGGRLVVPPHRDPVPAELGRLVRRERVTVLWLTAGLFQQIVDTALADLRGLRYLLAGGDVLSVRHVNEALSALPDTVLVNGYGPTENTTFSCCHQVGSAVRTPTVPIGRPINGSSAHVLETVAPGEVGELYTGGLGVAHGYLGDPALTAQRFLPDPFAEQPGSRMYRTGDLVRCLPGGDLEFVGRADRQVKIRGFRVEPGEVEAVIAELPGVREAVAVAQRGPANEVRLAGFVTGTVSTLDLRRQLTERLPDYAVPTFVMAVDQLPLTANGKVDRAALAGRTMHPRPEVRSAHRPPDTALEHAVVRLWTDLLGVEGIGADDDFFELGGHSLLGVRVVSDLHAEYGVELSPMTFYLDPTPAGLARALASGEEAR